MNNADAYRFANLPSHSTVAAAVTLAVSGWLFLATASIVSGTPEPLRAEAPAAAMASASPAPAALSPAVAPDVRETIVVEARRA